ncbi:matrixin family metalloprotease [Limosilactobacillus fastidiosus]|uniref:Matrixin family metalloprotease n=1 Tax=Limosilactobacillus fastidiosus TaxID=2759855 RepID=A0A7W3TZV8_9LACO|nr:matrixin family metalloprotease [Limosilactobacillus fastidiosus]MBB1063778.1 matrixin family metalloprotease [Limosilactobacillus fastidiosus]MBB1086351.1 matrixin family metalloprotease [Limosilactobacillus fastidiosus]MCD7084353.1 matrixin family metalloprotease [Limosilactobacillus fastidiosus]MCD7086274.1 matrixin family metalloprotease [Limosilactobacillus fastidiosus]MCD7115037.1 matrixin family metalloprotease [Limosilactobacillus fastidiosus]
MAEIGIFRLFKRLVIWTLIIGGCWLYFTNSQIQAASTAMIWSFRQRIVNLIGNNGENLNLSDSSQKSQQPDQQKTDSTTIPTNGRWATNTATIYVSTGNKTLDSAAQSAIQQWNQTGAFTFRPVTSRQQAEIVVSAMDNDSTNAAGLTKTSTNSINNHFVHANVYLNQRYLLDPGYGYDQQRIINTAEHELGHAIGLDHTKQVSVMQPAGSFYTIQPVDVQAVKKLYATN